MSPATETGYPTLKHLFAAYLHSDWKAEFGTVQAAVKSFAHDDGHKAVDAALDELEGLAAIDEVQLPAILEDLGCGVDPWAHGDSPQGFLLDVISATLLAAAGPALLAAGAAAPVVAKQPAAKAKKVAPKVKKAAANAKKVAPKVKKAAAKAKKVAAKAKRPAAKAKKAPKAKRTALKGQKGIAKKGRR